MHGLLPDFPDFDAHELVQIVHDRASGLVAIIALHSTHCGPASGGVRAAHYRDFGAGLADALRLSRAMSLKTAMAGLALGGGKAVVPLLTAAGSLTPAMVTAFADAVEALGGRYVTARDAGISAGDMQIIATRTAHVAGLPGPVGEPAPWTARGLVGGILAAAERALGRSSLRGLHVAVQGPGAVGLATAQLLLAAGARVTLAGRDAERTRALAGRIGAQAVAAEAVLALACDVVCHCALGGVLDARAIARLQAPIVAGGANNQLADPALDAELAARGVLLAPDFVINAGGMMAIAVEHAARQRGSAPDIAGLERLLAGIPARLHAVWDESARSGTPPQAVAVRMAERLIGRA